MPIPVWKCAVCPTIHRSEEDAYKCEKQHRCYEEFKITAAIYSDNSGLYGQSLTVNQTVPNRIRVRFSARGDDHGLYQLISYGPRGI